MFGASLIFVLDMIVFDHSGAWKSLGVLCAVVLVVAIIQAGSQNATVSVLLGVLAYLMVVFVEDARKAAAAIVTLGLTIAVVLLVLASIDETRELVLPRGGSYRLDIWRVAVEKTVAASVWFGNGIATSDNIVVAELEFAHPHNIYLAAFFQGGLVAVLFLIALIVNSLWILFENYQDRDAKLALGLLAIALPGYMLDGHEIVDKVSDIWFLFWLPIAICLGLSWRKPAVDETDS